MNPNTPQLDLPEEFGITPVYGFRSWGLSNGCLSSLNYKLDWKPGEMVVAECKRCAQPPSLDRCGDYGRGCGIYASHRVENLSFLHWQSFIRPFWGVVEGWGKVVWHKDGWRAKFARVLALIDTGPISRTMADQYDVPCIPQGRLYEMYPPQVQWRMS